MQALCTYLYLQHPWSMDWLQYPGSLCWLCVERWILCKYCFFFYRQPITESLNWLKSIGLYGNCSATILCFIQTSYENWQDDEPNNYNNVENCAEMTFWWWRKTGEWNDLHCEDKREWFCEIRRGKETQKYHRFFFFFFLTTAYSTKQYSVRTPQRTPYYMIRLHWSFYINDFTSLTFQAARGQDR